MRAKDFLNKPTGTVESIAQKHSVSVEQIKQQLAKGIEVELEHTSHKDVAREIALDHLGEFPDYYDRLDQAEKILTERVVDQIAVGNYTVKIDQHLLDQAIERGIHDPRKIIQTLNKLPSLKPKLKSIADGEKFWIHDNDVNNDISLGFRTINHSQKLYILMTAIKGKPWTDINHNLEVY